MEGWKLDFPEGVKIPEGKWSVTIGEIYKDVEHGGTSYEDEHPDDWKFDVECPVCKEWFHAGWGALHNMTGQEFTCEHCRTRFKANVDEDEFVLNLEEIIQTVSLSDVER